MPSKSSRLMAVADEVSRCYLCPFAFDRENPGLMAGSAAAKIGLIAEAPGDEEDKAAEALVGPAGQDMTDAMLDFGLKRDHFFMCNILKCRPQGVFVKKNNETPRPEWVKNCFGYLWRQIDIVRPELIILTGFTSARWVLNLSTTRLMRDVVGQKGVADLFGPYPVDWEMKYVIMYHPAAKLHARNTDRRATIVKNIRDTFHYARSHV